MSETVTLKKPDQVARELAASLEVPPEEIHQYRLYDQTYAVILADMRKVAGVARTVLDDGHTGDPVYVPIHLLAAYDHPTRATKVQVMALLDYLEVDYDARLTRKPLVQRLLDWKEKHAP